MGASEEPVVFSVGAFIFLGIQSGIAVKAYKTGIPELELGILRWYKIAKTMYVSVMILLYFVSIAVECELGDWQKNSIVVWMVFNLIFIFVEVYFNYVIIIVHYGVSQGEIGYNEFNTTQIVPLDDQHNSRLPPPPMMYNTDGNYNTEAPLTFGTPLTALELDEGARPSTAYPPNFYNPQPPAQRINDIPIQDLTVPGAIAESDDTKTRVPLFKKRDKQRPSKLKGIRRNGKK